MSTLSDKALDMYRNRQDTREKRELQELREKRSSAITHAERLLEVPASSLDLGTEYESQEWHTWLFRTQGMKFWLKYVGGDRVWQLYVQNVWGEGHPVDTLVDLGEAIHVGHVKVCA